MQPHHPHTRHSFGSARVLLAGLALIAATALGATDYAHAVTFDFENFTPLENTPAFPLVNADGAATLTMQAPRSGSHAFDLLGNDFSTTGPSYAYFKVFDVSIPVGYYTTLEYFVMPISPAGKFVAVDLLFSDGRTLRESGAVDQFGVPVHPAAQGAGGHLQANRYNQVTSAIGKIMTGTITQIIVAYDQAPTAAFYHAIIDDITISDKKPLVPVKGRMVNENDQPFSDPKAIVDPSNSNSTCGPSLAVQSKSSKACAGPVNSFVALTRIYNFADMRFKARIPSGRDVLVSVCGKDGRYECDDHPADSFCRPLQSPSSATISLAMAPNFLPAYVGIWWKYVPESQAGLYPACDKGGSPRRVSASGTAGRGDADFDGFLTVTDGVRLLRCAAGISKSSGCFFNGDFDTDGTVTSTDAAMVFRAAAGLPFCGTDCDTDGDLLPDRWEVGGYDDNGDGEIDVDLPAFGARMFHKDVFVECDYMVGTDHTHRPLNQAVAMVVNAFAQAPVTQPDGSTGLRLHVDTGNLGGGEALPHDDDLQPVGDELNALRSEHFNPARQRIFHYCVFGHNHSSGTSSGASLTVPGDDFVVTLGSFGNQVGSLMEQSGTFMHELGHNLGLLHGGFEDRNHKPNYLSVMNYSYQLGLIVNGTAAAVDYERFPTNPLNESALNEVQGLNTPTGDGPLAPYGCIYSTAHNIFVTKTACAANVDWNGNGNPFETSVSVNVNDDGSTGTLQAFEDWQHLVFNGGTVGSGAPPPVAQGPSCITAEETALIEQSLLSAGALLQPVEEQQ